MSLINAPNQHTRMIVFRSFLMISVLMGGLGGVHVTPLMADARSLSNADRQGHAPRQAHAQLQTSHQRRSHNQVRSGSFDRNQGVGSVPDWAKARSPSRTDESQAPIRGVSPDVTTNNPPTFPDDPVKAPVGPASWLAIFGLGYGIIQLRKGPS